MRKKRLEQLLHEAYLEGYADRSKPVKSLSDYLISDTKKIADNLDNWHLVMVASIQWSNHTAGPMDWHEAVEYAKDLEEDGFIDWRVPTIEELTSLINYSKVDPASNEDLRPAYYWSSTPYVEDANFGCGAWNVNFNFGNVNYNNKSDTNYVRCVRDLTTLEEKIMEKRVNLRGTQSQEVINKYETSNFEEKLSKVLSEIQNLLISKNKKYGNSALKPSRIFSNASPVEQLLVRIDDKLSRIKQTGIGKQPDEDTVNDLIGYLLLLKMEGHGRD